ncbi:beta-lactamase/transpeptidase-like protein [Nemania diffusa]|nr:beta-lactamase/transpeptidase-like protein [Nemania diffusa]
MHYGKAIYRANYGYRDVASRLPPTSDTVFPIASMTKAMVASAFATLVDDGQLSWETKLSDLVPEYRQMSDHIKCPELVTKANRIDLLAHRLGLTTGNNF